MLAWLERMRLRLQVLKAVREGLVVVQTRYVPPIDPFMTIFPVPTRLQPLRVAQVVEGGWLEHPQTVCLK